MAFYLLGQIDYLAVLVAALVGLVIGGVWYMPDVLGKTWIAAQGRSRWDLGDPRKAIAARTVATLVGAFALAVLMAGGGITTLGGALRLATVISFGIVTPVIVADYLLNGWSWKLILVTSGHRVLHIYGMCAVLGTFRNIG